MLCVEPRMLVWSCLGFWALFMRIQDDKVNNMLGVALQACGNILGADVAAGMCAWIIKGLIFLIGLVLLNISPSFVFSVWLIEKGLAPDAGCCWHRENSADLSRHHPEILGGFSPNLPTILGEFLLHGLGKLGEFISRSSRNTRRFFLATIHNLRRVFV